MSYLGNLVKMKATLNLPITYQLVMGDAKVELNSLLGKKIKLSFTGIINCTQCNRKISKSFQQGYCYPCYQRLLDCNCCVIHPERCRFHEGSCKPDDWAHANCGQPHIIYLANSSHLKVGITRESQVPTRWIDQGATQALPIIKVHNRHHSGLIEVVLKAFIADKTHWQAMLKGQSQEIDLIANRDQVLALASESLATLEQTWPQYPFSYLTDVKVVTLQYPILQYPAKVKALDFDKVPRIEGVLLGIKGQYLILDTGVLNIRKFTGYQVEFNDR